jgi:prepilin-type N-terminal cleavage/methylation domain-containing protein
MKKIFKKIFSKKLFFVPKNKGFTIIETIIAITILSVGIVGTYFFISHFVKYTSISKNRLTAAYLSLEGIEIVKNIRDSNWLNGINWNSGLGEGRWEADYTETASLSDGYDGDYLYLEDSGFFGYTIANGTSTHFKREIEICTSTDDIIYVSSTVSWAEGEESRSVTAEEKLFNWY